MARGLILKGNPISASEKPNIIFMVADDHGPWAFGAGGDPNARTPHLDRLAAAGGVLRRHFSMSAVCSPARACLITGRHSTEHGIPDYLPKESRREGAGIGLEPGLATWPQCLQEAGYATALFGKWHLGGQDRHHPTRHGYREFKGWRFGAGISKDPVVEIDGEDRKVAGYTPDIITDYATDFIRRCQDVPFLVSLHFWAPHANTGVTTSDGDRTWHPLKDEDWAPFKDTDPVIPNPGFPKLDIPRVKRMMREYLAAVHSVDRNVGRLTALLEELGLDRNTIVVYTSDNGYSIGHHGIWHKGNGRWILTDNRDGPRPNLYDNSLRLPAIVRWPGVVPPGSEYQQVLTSLDWFPTLCAAAGADVPDEKVRGRDMRGVFKGAAEHWDDDLFAQYEMWDWNQTGASLRTYRTPHWKLIRDFRSTVRDELYYLHDDPLECRNIIDVKESQVQKHRALLNEKLLDRMQRIDDPALIHIKG
ncbi:MAG: sulfatase-like hydrolase/transferase [Candidatus Brocadiia bacterium]